VALIAVKMTSAEVDLTAETQSLNHPKPKQTIQNGQKEERTRKQVIAALGKMMRKSI
jgi:hypothetical protein